MPNGRMSALSLIPSIMPERSTSSQRAHHHTLANLYQNTWSNRGSFTAAARLPCHKVALVEVFNAISGL
jgi:hypothetical protein